MKVTQDEVVDRQALLHVEVDHEALEVTRPSDHAPLVAVFRS